jgi:hypothetical protein
MTSRYLRPDLTNGTAVYKGLRYWVVQLSAKGPTEGFSKDDADYLVWDGAYGTAIGGAQQITASRFKCESWIGQGCDCSEASDYRGIARTVVSCVDSYLKHA